MNSRFVKILSIAILSAFLTGCIGDIGQDNQNTAEDYEEKSIDDYSKALADMEYAKQQFNQGNYINAAKGVFYAVKNFVSSKADEILGYMMQSRGSFVIDQSKITHKRGIKGIGDIAKEFADKSKEPAIDYYDGGKTIPLGQMAIKYSSMIGAERNATPLRQKLVATIQLHEAANYYGNAQLSILCNSDKTVDFGIGQVNTKSWKSICKDLVNVDFQNKERSIVALATDICENPQTYIKKYSDIVKGKKKFNINSFILEILKLNFGGEIGLTRDPRSPFNPITNSRCTYRHLDEDFNTVRRNYSCSTMEWTGRFRCSGNPSDYDYTALALMQYGGLKKGMLKNDIRLGKPGAVQQTFDDYMAEFRAAYAALFKEPPPF